MSPISIAAGTLPAGLFSQTIGGGAPEGKRNGNYKHGARSKENIGPPIATRQSILLAARRLDRTPGVACGGLRWSAGLVRHRRWLEHDCDFPQSAPRTFRSGFEAHGGRAGSRCERSICGQVIRYAGLIRGVAFGKPSVAPMSGFAFSAAATTAGPGGSAGLMCYSTNHTCINAVLEGRMRAIRQRVAGVAEVRHPVTAGTGR